MKKSLIALAILAACASAQAGGSISVEREHFSYRNSHDFINGTAILGSYGVSEKHALTVDGRYQFGKANDGSSFNTAEVGLRKDFPFADKFVFGLRGAVGRMYPQGYASISYRLVDGTVTYAATEKLALTAGLRFRNNFDGKTPTHSPMAWADYSVTDKDIVTVGFTRIMGRVEAKSVTAAYTRLF